MLFRCPAAGLFKLPAGYIHCEGNGHDCRASPPGCCVAIGQLALGPWRHGSVRSGEAELRQMVIWEINWQSRIFTYCCSRDAPEVLWTFRSYRGARENGLERSDHLRPTTLGPRPPQTPHLRPPTSDPPTWAPHLRPLEGLGRPKVTGSPLVWSLVRTMKPRRKQKSYMQQLIALSKDLGELSFKQILLKVLGLSKL